MKILAVSDTHGNNAIIRDLITEEAPDLLIHAGDVEGDLNFVYIPMKAVSGNNDWSRLYPDEEILTAGGHRILITHGHKQRAGWEIGPLLLSQRARERNCDICIFGHTHKPCDEEGSGVRLINPGSLAYPRGSTTGYMIIDIDETTGNVDVTRKQR